MSPGKGQSENETADGEKQLHPESSVFQGAEERCSFGLSGERNFRVQNDVMIQMQKQHHEQRDKAKPVNFPHVFPGAGHALKRQQPTGSRSIGSGERDFRFCHQWMLGLGSSNLERVYPGMFKS